MHGIHDSLASTVDADWVGYGHDVLAVADGVVVDARDGIPNGRPLAPQETPDDLTARTLYGNFVILRIAPDTYAHYAHLQNGSLAVKIGQKVKRGGVLGRLGQTGAAGAPHLHFHLSDRPTFEQSEGLPYSIDAFVLLGRGTIEDTFDPAKPVDLLESQAHPRRSELPLDGSVVMFP
ncbi:MAG: M23 family metallopeptidase [Pseudomonadota bacterium]|nr:M23 family metallopeptidase [Pseudomonadota bacterium]